MCNDGGLEGDGVVVAIFRVTAGGGLQAEPLPDGGRLRLLVARLGALLGQGVGGNPDALLGSGGVLEKGGFLLELSGTRGVGRTSSQGLFLEVPGSGSGVIA